MKRFSLPKVIVTLIAMIIIASSCTSTKKMAVKCPDFSTSYKSKELNHPRNKTKNYAVNQNINIPKHSNSKSKAKYARSQKEDLATINSSGSNENIPDQESYDRNAAIKVFEYEANLYASLDKSTTTPVDAESDFLSTSVDISADFENGGSIYERVNVNPINTGVISEMDFVMHSFKMPATLSATPLANMQQDGTLAPKQTEGLGLAGMIVSLAGLLILPIPCGIVGVVLSAISLGRINKNPGKYKGKGFAIAGLVVGLVVLILGIALIV